MNRISLHRLGFLYFPFRTPASLYCLGLRRRTLLLHRTQYRFGVRALPCLAVAQFLLVPTISACGSALSTALIIASPYVSLGFLVDHRLRTGTRFAKKSDRQGPIPDPVATTTWKFMLINKSQDYGHMG